MKSFNKNCLKPIVGAFFYALLSVSLCPLPALATAVPSQSVLTVPYQLPNALNIRYETSILGLSGKSILNFKRINDTYDASLNTSAKVLFKRFEMFYGSSGKLTKTGLQPIRIQEKRLSNPLITTTLDPIKQQAVSSQSGILDYEANGVDILSVAIQLAVLQQVNPKWKKAGMSSDFKAYRPSGLTTWRFESQGMHTITVAGKPIETLYIKRVPLNSSEQIDEQHLWLDPMRYGFPIKMRFVDKKGRGADILMVNWEES
jgi:hypothetical protein